MRKIFLSLLEILVILVSARGQVNAPSEVPTASIYFHAVDVFGHLMPCRVSDFRGATGRNFAETFRGVRAFGIPLGGYDYELVPIDSKRFRPMKGHVNLTEPGERWLTLLVSDHISQYAADAPITAGQNEGRVVGIDGSKGPVWIRLSFAFTGETVDEVPVAGDGRFKLQKAHTGTFLLVLYQGDTVLHVATVPMNGPMKSTLKIDVAQASANLVK